MGKKHKGNRSGKEVTQKQPAKRPSSAVAFIVLAAVVVACLGLWWRANHPGAARPSMVSGQAEAATQPAASDKPDFAKLKGKWQRPDGGYVLEVRGVADDGKIDAAYLNPNPINVARAATSYEAGQM
jgi:hypothetical protein